MSKLNHVYGRVVISCDLEAKNWHTFSDGTKIRRERQFNELNRRITEPVNAIVISDENIPKGSEILIHPNATHDSNRIFNHSQLSGKDEGSSIRYYSIPESQCFIWRDGNEWKALPPYETGLRIFEPYRGILHGIDHKLIKDCLYVTSGDLKGKVVKTLKACDYEIIFQNVNGQESRIIRFRPNGCEKTNRDPEAIAIMEELTDKVFDGELLVGIEIKDAKPIKETAYAY